MCDSGRTDFIEISAQLAAHNRPAGLLAIAVSDHHGALRRGKGPVAAHSGARTVHSHDSEMVSSMGSQAADVGSNISVRIASLTLHSRGVAVTGRRAILERNRRGQPMWIE